MKQFNKWLLALVVLLLSVGGYAQCGDAVEIGVNDSQTPTLTAVSASTDSAWYFFVPLSNGYITISSCDRTPPEKDTRLFLYDGSCGALNSIGTSDNDCGLAALLNDVPVQAGVTYYLVWDNKTAGDLTFTFSTSFVATGDYVNPANDDICDASLLTLGVGVMGNNENATIQGSAEYNVNVPVVATDSENGWITDHNVHNTVWYKFVAPTTGAVTISAEASFDIQVAMFDGSCTDIAGLNMWLADDASEGIQAYVDFTSYCVQPGQTYYIMVDGFGTESGDFDILVDSLDILRPFVLLTSTSTNPVNGVLCPGADNFNLDAELLVAADSSEIMDAGYVNSLHYVWKNSSNATIGTTAYVGDREADTYTLTVTDTCGNTYTASVTLTDTSFADLDLVLEATTNPTCVGAASGTATLSHSGGHQYADGDFEDTDSLEFTIKFNSDIEATNAELAASAASGVSNFDVFDNLLQGSYRVYLQDACGNVDSVSFVLTDPTFSLIQLDSILGVNPYCPGTATGSFDLHAAGGEGLALVYDWSIYDSGDEEWDGTGITTQDLTDVYAGFYRVIVSDPCEHQDQDTLYVTLVDPTVEALSYTSTVTNPTTFAANNGAIALTVSGGKPAYHSTWWVDGNVWSSYDNMLSLTSLPQGVYHVVIWDTCGSAGYIDTTFVLLAPVANDSACSAILITENDSLTTYHNTGATATNEADLVMPLNQDEGFDGWADVNFNQGVWFKFVAPQSGAVALWANHYQGLVANLNFDAQLALYEADNCSGTKTLVAANDNNFNGGAVNDAYLEAFCLTEGNTYYVLVDGYQGIGQEGIFNLYMESIGVEPLTFGAEVTQPNCIDESGTVTVESVMGGIFRSAPEQYLYTYTFSGGATGTIEVDGDGDITAVDGGITSSLTFSGLAAGNYTLTIKDTCGNSHTENIVITPNTFVPFGFDYTLEQPYCPGDDNGSIEFLVTGGGTPGEYLYEVRQGSASNPYFASGEISSSIATYVELNGADLYFIKIYDGCDNANTKEYVVELTDRVLTDFAAMAEAVMPTCPDAENASITATLTGGRLEGWYSLSNGDPVASGYFEGTVTIGDLAADTYWLYIEDNCSGDTTIEIIIEDPTPTALVVADSAVNPSTNEGTDGWYSYSISGGFPSYNVNLYVLDMPLGTPTDTIVANFTADDNTEYTSTNLAAGFYRLSINDACGEIISADEVVEFELKNPPLNNNACEATTLTTDGTELEGTTVAATVQDGEALITPSLDEDCDSYIGWCQNDGIDGSVWYTMVVPASGSFSVEVASGDFDPQVAVYSTDNCESFGSFNLEAANDNKALSPLNENAYVEVGCLTPGSTVYVLVDGVDGVQGGFTIWANETNTGALEVLENITNATTEASANGAIDVLVMGGVKPYTYSWSTGSTEEDLINLAPGTYTLTVTDKCENTVSKTYVITYSSISNDNSCNAKWLSVDNVNREYNNIFATLQAGESSIAPDANSQDCFGTMNWCKNDGVDGTVWFKFIAPSSSVKVDLCNDAQNAIDPQLAVYSVGLCAEFATYTLLGANDDSPTCSFGSVLTLTDLTPCATYYIMVDSDEGEQGTFGIELTDMEGDLNAGNDTTVTVCQNSGDLDLASVRTLGADTDGAYSDDDDTEALGGSIFNTNAVEAGTYHFTYTVADSCGMSQASADYASITVVVQNCTGVNEVAAGDFFAIYPNPNNGNFTIENKVADAISVEVRDVTGKLVYTNNFNATAGSKVAISLNAAAKGLYTVRVNGEAFGTEVRRVVVH